MSHRLPILIALAALLVPATGAAAPPAHEGVLAILDCERVDRGSCPALVAAYDERDAAAGALADWLEEATLADDGQLMSRAAVALAALGDATRASALHKAAAKAAANGDVQADLLAAAARLGDKGAADGLLALLAKGSPRAKVVATGALGVLKAREAVPSLIAALKDDKQMRLQATAAQALGLIGDNRGIAPLLSLAGRPKVYAPARIQALDALTSFRARAAVPLATQLIDHPERDVGRAALRLLTAVPTRYVEPAIAFALKTPLLRGEASRTAVAMKASNLGPLILEAAVDPALPAAERTWALHALGVFPPTDTATRLLDRFKDAQEEERIALLKALPDIGDRSVIPRLINTLAQSQGEVANYVVYALENLSGKRFGADLRAWREFADEAGKAKAPALPAKPATKR